MMKNKLTVIILLIFILIGGGTLAVMHYNFGRPVDVATDKQLNGVPEDLENILYYASFAPNSHNIQMWKVGLNLENQVIRIKMDQSRVLKAVDPVNREAYISLGSYAQNLLEACRAFGYETNCSIMSDENGAYIDVKYEKKLAENQHLLKMIAKRHTNKSQYDTNEIPKSKIAMLLQSNAGLFYFPKHSEAFKKIKNDMILAGEQQSKKQDVRDELATWLRFSDRETIKKKDGLSAEQFGFNGIKKIIYYLFTNRNSARQDTFAKQGNDIAIQQIDHSAGFLLLTSDNSEADWIRVGMTLQTVWLQATQLDIAVHPMSVVLEEEPFRTELTSSLKLEQPIQMLLRIGQVKNYGKNNKIRRDLADYVTIE